ncbi:CAP domain-containing protein [Photobacterium sp. WH77]|uniref:CAP domain-containing protein n=1 Tax=unclassified Photobacterium TaxID=2628852 RepID=UPI001EDC19F2|nr:MULTISPECIES: CAP domain-containing protein [unclassified Photobacterium]MCG2838400.1 CAP domain-containing protein [Photobacterium sp. WH77]MCG2846017.1 CAP domain-containing protein [Photobacterium sp. WH80]
MRILTVLILSMFALVGCGGSDGGSGDSSTSHNGSSVSNGGSSERPTTGGGDQTTGGSTGSGSDGTGTGSNTGGSDQTGSGSSNQSMADEMLAAVNAARAQGQDCGGTWMPAVAPLTWDATLEQTAFLHSSDMANYDYFSHTGLDGSSPSSRVTAQGYSWKTVGENIAAGQKTVSAVMQGWLESPGHCRNIMNGSFTQMGAASDTNSGSTYGIYWTQVFASPK